MLPGLQRLGLRGVKSIQPQILMPFVLSFPSLTHLDLSGTRVTPELLYALVASQTVRLQSLALARCVMLTGESLKDFLVDAPAATQIRELTLYGDRTFPSPLSENDLHQILALAPCFISGELLYLDLSSAPVTKELLQDVCKPQLKLRSLGLSYIPDLELNAIADFVKTKTPNVEVLTLVGTSPALEHRGSARHASVTLHTKIIRPLSTPPFSLTVKASPLTRVRVVELSVPILSSLGAGAGAWRIVRSKGGRGWYVDTSSGWVDGVLMRDLSENHPLRVELQRLADANGNVNSGVGWHARKMEVNLIDFRVKLWAGAELFMFMFRSCKATGCLDERMVFMAPYHSLTRADVILKIRARDAHIDAISLLQVLRTSSTQYIYRFLQHHESYDRFLALAGATSVVSIYAVYFILLLKYIFHRCIVVMSVSIKVILATSERISCGA